MSHLSRLVRHVESTRVRGAERETPRPESAQPDARRRPEPWRGGAVTATVLILVVTALGILAGLEVVQKRSSYSSPSMAARLAVAAPPSQISPQTGTEMTVRDVLESGPVKTPPVRTGTFTGTVTVQGDIPARPPLVKAPPFTVPDELIVIDPKTGGLQNVAVFLRRVPTGVVVPPDNPPAVSLVIQPGRFSPHVMTVRTNQTLNVSSRWNQAANLRTSPFANRAANFTVPALGSGSLMFPSRENVPVSLNDDIHQWMSGHLVVVDNPWADVTDAKGAFSIPKLPVGDYEFTVWHEAIGYIDRKLAVSITDDATTTRDVAVPPVKFKLRRDYERSSQRTGRR